MANENFSQEEVLQKIKEIIANRLEIPENKIEKQIVISADIVHDLGADSMDFVEIIMELEETFKLSMPDEVLEKVRTPSDLLDFVANSLQKKQSLKKIH